MTPRRVTFVFCLLIALAGCAARSPEPSSPLVLSYRWTQAAPLPSGANTPPAVIAVQREPGALPAGGLDALAVIQCLAWDRRPSNIATEGKNASFACNRPLIGAPEETARR
ncbi:MAG: hypothetical protein ACREFQ_19560 [Stellaceae bacterium]